MLPRANQFSRYKFSSVSADVFDESLTLASVNTCNRLALDCVLVRTFDVKMMMMMMLVEEAAIM